MITNSRTGAHDLIETLLASGVDTCFANPGTSEMHFVAALSDFPAMRSVLCLFEGCVTGAADGYARMTGRPAATLLHLGPGLANGLANLHNARKAGTAIVNVIGDHATYHRQYDAPLTSDVEGTAAPYSHWVHTSPGTAELASDTAEAVAQALSGGGSIASLILPADAAWSPARGSAAPRPPRTANVVAASDIGSLAGLLRERGGEVGLILGGELLHGPALERMGRIAAATGATLLAPYASGRTRRGAGTPRLRRIPFPVDQGLATLKPYRTLVLLGAQEPVAFFAYPGKPSRLVPEGTELIALADRTHDLPRLADDLAAALGASDRAFDAEPPALPDAPGGPLTASGFSATVARAIREGTILIDEGVTTTRELFDMARGAPRHDFLPNVGGSIGAGMPLALGAAIACPDRPVLSINGDGSAAYTLQALWSMAQQALNVTVVICANRRYAILSGEMERVGANRAEAQNHTLLSLATPEIDWVALARGFGVPGERVDTCEAFAAALAADRSGPRLIEARLD